MPNQRRKHIKDVCRCVECHILALFQTLGNIFWKNSLLFLLFIAVCKRRTLWIWVTIQAQITTDRNAIVLQAMYHHRMKRWKEWHAPKLYYLFDIRIKFAFRLFAFSVSPPLPLPMELWFRCLRFALDVHSTSKLIDMIWLWYCSNLCFVPYKREVFEWFYTLFFHRTRKKKLMQWHSLTNVMNSGRHFLFG